MTTKTTLELLEALQAKWLETRMVTDVSFDCGIRSAARALQPAIDSARNDAAEQSRLRGLVGFGGWVVQPIAETTP